MAGKFLIASKNRAMLKTVERALQEEGHQVIVAPNGVAVVDLALDQKPDAIFLSSVLGGLSGLDAARALRALALTETVPIIFLVEEEEEAKKIRDARLPLTECLVAPYDLAELKTHAAAGWHTGKHVALVRPSKGENPWMMAILDPLTQLYHRRYLMHVLGYEAKRSARYKSPLSILLVDVDNLQEINRQYGILTGDSVLIETAQLLLKMMRHAEILGRNDVQDFLAIAPHTDRVGVRSLAERIVKAISEHHFVLEKMDLHVTVSVGVAAAAGGDLSENLALLGRAELALTHAKQAGKNRFEME